MPITTALTRTEGGLTSDNVICPCVNRQKAHWWLGAGRPKSWDCRCAELTASAEATSNRRANKPASADFATNAHVFRSSCRLLAMNQTVLNDARLIFTNRRSREYLDATTNIRGSAKRNAAFTLQHGAMLTPRQPEGCVPVVVSRSRCARNRTRCEVSVACGRSVCHISRNEPGRATSPAVVEAILRLRLVPAVAGGNH